VIRSSASTIAILPVRGGSKGIPDKNLAELAGKPLMAWTIEAMARASLDMRLVVTTDSQAIAEVATGLGAEIIGRPANLARDTSQTEPAVTHALQRLDVNEDDILILLQATSPVRLPGTIERAHEKFISSKCDSLVAVVQESPFVWHGPTDSPSPTYNVNARARRQDVSPDKHNFRETGSFYMSNVGPFVRSGNRIHGTACLFVTESCEGVDIDTYLDLTIANSILVSLKTDPA
jgi:N-acylneuraminate cytidylyltransferase